MTAPLRAKKSNKIVAMFILGLLAVSLLGFGVRSVGGGGGRTVASVGDQEVTVDEFARALNTGMRNLSRQIGRNLTLEEARSFGIEQDVLAGVIAEAAFNGEARRIGLSVGDGRIRDTILKTDAFQGVDGKFDETAYRYALEQAGLKPAEYDEILRRENARLLLQAAIAGGIAPGDTYGRALLAFIGEKRSASWAALTPAMLAEPVRDPSEAEIKSWYDGHAASYTSPRLRALTYAALTPKMLIPTITADEAELRALYDSQPERFNTPEKRLVDRVVFGSAAEAEAARAAIESGDKTFKDVVEARGLALGDVDLGEVTQSSLGAAGDAVFAVVEPGLAGPVETDLGPALFRVNVILAAKATPFETARQTLLGEYAADEARRRIDDSITGIDDLLASGATLEDLAAETDMQIGHLDYAAGNTEGIAANPEFRTAAMAVKKEDFPEVKTMATGGIFALRLDGIAEPALKPLSEVRAQVIADWKAAETIRVLGEYAKANKERLDAGESFASLALEATTSADLRRESRVDGTPAAFVSRLFELAAGETAVVTEGATVVVMRLDAIAPFDPADPENAALLENVRKQLGGQIGLDITEAVNIALQDREGITVNQALVNAVFNQSTRARAPAPAPAHN